MLTFIRSEITMPTRAVAPRDIRHLVICPQPIKPHHCLVYLGAREQVVEDCSRGDSARIVLLTGRSRQVGPLPFDVPVDILPVFIEPTPERYTRINRAIFSCIFASVRADSVFRIHASRHPILLPILEGMRALEIAYSMTPAKGSA
jgi:hypothetical protein